MFELTDKQKEILKSQIDVWNKLILEKQKYEMTSDEFKTLTCDGMYPYFGAVGGNYTYSFTQTSIGVIVEVKDNYLNETIDLSGL